MTEVVIAALDVGAVRNVGYWRYAPEGEGGGQSLGDLADRLAIDLNSGRAVALGFEAPLFLPLPEAPGDLNRQRVGERGRPWCAGAGTGAFAMGSATVRMGASGDRALHTDHAFGHVRPG